MKTKEFWKGFDFACQLLEDMGYTGLSVHPYNIADCLKAKMNRLPKNKIRKTVHKKNLSLYIQILKNSIAHAKKQNAKRVVMKITE